MAIEIGEKKLATRRPADLDQQLLDATGCSSAEIAGMLSRAGNPALVAQALQPFLSGSDKMEVADLAVLIGEDDTGTVPGQVIALLGGPPADDEPAEGSDAQAS